MAYGVDKYPDSPENPGGHWEWDWNSDTQENERRWVDDEIEEEGE
jgi:hypothetical protein